MKNLNGTVLGLSLVMAACNAQPSTQGDSVKSLGDDGKQLSFQLNPTPEVTPTPSTTPAPQPTPSASPTFVQPSLNDLTFYLQLQNRWVTSINADANTNETRKNAQTILINNSSIFDVMNISLKGFFYQRDLQGASFQISQLSVDGSSITYDHRNINYVKAQGKITITGTITGTYNVGNGNENYAPSDFNILPGTYYYSIDHTQQTYGSQPLKVMGAYTSTSSSFDTLQGGSLKLYSDTQRQNLVYSLAGVTSPNL